MKSLRYILIALSLAGTLTLGAQHLAQRPEFHMRSTSVLLSSASTPEPSAVNGVRTTALPSAQLPSAQAPGSPLKNPLRDGSLLRMDDPFGGQTIGNSNIEDPIQPGSPIGDAAWPLMLCALMYGAIILNHRRRLS